MKAFLVVLLVAGAYAAPRLHKPKIVGGTAAADGEFPYQASIRILGAHNCGGSVISSNTILTAAHCDFPFIPLTAVVGTIKMLGEGQSYNIQKLVVHPEFSYDLLMNDVAVGILTEEIVFNDKVQPIPLNTANVIPESTCTLTGWGLTNYPGFPFTDLQKIDLKILSNQACLEMHASEGLQIYDSQVCTLTEVGEGACMGDSGGPLVQDGKQIGIVSWGSPCAVGQPDVYTNVSAFIDWVNGVKA